MRRSDIALAACLGALVVPAYRRLVAWSHAQLEEEGEEGRDEDDVLNHPDLEALDAELSALAADMGPNMVRRYDGDVQAFCIKDLSRDRVGFGLSLTIEDADDLAKVWYAYNNEEEGDPDEVLAHLNLLGQVLYESTKTRRQCDIAASHSSSASARI